MKKVDIMEMRMRCFELASRDLGSGHRLVETYEVSNRAATYWDWVNPFSETIGLAKGKED